MAPFKQLYVYIAECSDESFYTGVTNDFNRRIDEHNSEKNYNSYTFSRRPVTLKYIEPFRDFNSAIAREKQIKGWSRAKKLALINGNINLLKQLSNRKNIDKRE
ncbi:MAG: GIY-YIG nuclease family protein [Bacteroidota bacterium]